MPDDAFHDRFQELTTAMLQHCYDFLDGDERIQEIYVYGGVSALLVFNCFYRIDGELLTLPAARPKLGITPNDPDTGYAFLHEGNDLVAALRLLFHEHDQEPFTQLKTVYDVHGESMRLHLDYEPIDEESSSMQEFDRWSDAVLAGAPALPDDA